MTKNKNKQKAKFKTGITVSCRVYTDKEKDAGEFVMVCSFCGFEFWNYSKDATELICQKCGVQVGRLLKDEWERPNDSPERKVFMFDIDGGVSYIWMCHCGCELNRLANDLSCTTCEKCESITAKLKGAKVETMPSKGYFKI